ncbi:MAG TPA: universal stress protein [Candidatus Methylomirabilis sp.]|nr:universal stress protein [Candidatus Methylomirabilis sp.]
MAKRILLPLDRSETSQAVLPVVAELARGSGATVRLLHVAPVPRERVADDGRVVAYANQEMERIESERRRFLKAAEAELEGVPVEAVVRFGNPADEILLEADVFGADLIAVTAHGRGWFRHLLSDVVGALFRRSDVPVLVLASR